MESSLVIIIRKNAVREFYEIILADGKNLIGRYPYADEIDSRIKVRKPTKTVAKILADLIYEKIKEDKKNVRQKGRKTD